jgi:hypothetical protein
MVAFYTADTVHYSIRSSGGTWGADTVLDPGVAPKTAGPRAVLGANDTVHVAYYGMDGAICIGAPARRKRDLPAQPASGPHHASGIRGRLPLVFVPLTNTVIIYRHADGGWKRRVVTTER